MKRTQYVAGDDLFELKIDLAEGKKEDWRNH